MERFISKSTEDTQRIGEAFAKDLKPGAIVLLYGELGAGKTAFTRGIAAGLGLPSELVSSPTYTFLREYIGDFITLAHFDMYRVNSFEGQRPVINGIV